MPTTYHKYNPIRGSYLCRRVNSQKKNGNSSLRTFIKRQANRAIRRDKSEHPMYSGSYWE